MAAAEDGSMDSLGEGAKRETATLLHFVSVATSDIQQKLSKPSKPKRKVNIRKYIQRNVHSPCGVLRRSREGRSEPYPCPGKSGRKETANVQAESENLEAWFESVTRSSGHPESETKGALPMRRRNLPASFFRQPGAVGSTKEDAIRACGVQQALSPQGQALCGSMESLSGMEMEMMGRYFIPDSLYESFDIVRVEARTPQTAYDGSPGRLGSPLACSVSPEPIVSTSSPDSSSLPSYSPCGQRSASTPLNEAFSLPDLDDHLIGYPLPTLSPSCLQDITQTALPPGNPPFSNSRRAAFDGLQQSNGTASASNLHSVSRSISGSVERPESHPNPHLSNPHLGTDSNFLRSTQSVNQCGPFHSTQQQMCPSSVTNAGTHPSSHRLPHLNAYSVSRSSPSQRCQQYPPMVTTHNSPSLSNISITAGASHPSPLSHSNTAVQRCSPHERCGQYPSFSSIHNLFSSQTFAGPSSQVMTSSAASFSSTLPVLAPNLIAPVLSCLSSLPGTQGGASCSTANTNCYPGLLASQGCVAGVRGQGQGGVYGGLQAYHVASLSPSGLPAFPQAFPTPTTRPQEQCDVEMDEQWMPCDTWSLDDLC